MDLVIHQPSSVFAQKSAAPAVTLLRQKCMWHVVSEKGLGLRNIKDPPVPPPAKQKLSLVQVAQNPIQTDLEHLQGCGTHSCSGYPVPVPHHPHSS